MKPKFRPSADLDTLLKKYWVTYLMHIKGNVYDMMDFNEDFKDVVSASVGDHIYDILMNLHSALNKDLFSFSDKYYMWFRDVSLCSFSTLDEYEKKCGKIDRDDFKKWVYSNHVDESTKVEQAVNFLKENNYIVEQQMFEFAVATKLATRLGYSKNQIVKAGKGIYCRGYIKYNPAWYVEMDGMDSYEKWLIYDNEKSAVESGIDNDYHNKIRINGGRIAYRVE